MKKIKEVLTYKDDKYLLNIRNDDNTFSKIYIYDGNELNELLNSPEIRILKNHYRSIYKDNSGRIWLNSENGLFLLESNEWVLKKENFISEPFDITKPIVDELGNTFIAIGFPESIKAIWVLYKNKKRFEKYKNLFSVSRDLDITFNNELISLNT